MWLNVDDSDYGRVYTSKAVQFFRINAHRGNDITGRESSQHRESVRRDGQLLPPRLEQMGVGKKGADVTCDVLRAVNSRRGAIHGIFSFCHLYFVIRMDRRNVIVHPCTIENQEAIRGICSAERLVQRAGGEGRR